MANTEMACAHCGLTRVFEISRVNRAKKSEYDRKRRANLQFGDFADAALLLQDIEKEIDCRASRYEISLQNGTLNKAQTRRRSL